MVRDLPYQKQENGNILVWNNISHKTSDDSDNYLILPNTGLISLKEIRRFDFWGPGVKDDIKTLKFDNFCIKYPRFPKDENIYALLKNLL